MKILSGHSLSGSIKLADGGTISLKYKPKGKKPPLAKGRYFLQVTLADHSTMEGNVNFDPEVDGCESPVEKVMGKTPRDAKSPIVKVKIAEYVLDNNKKWRGVWYKKPKCIANS